MGQTVFRKLHLKNKSWFWWGVAESISNLQTNSECSNAFWLQFDGRFD